MPHTSTTPAPSDPAGVLPGAVSTVAVYALAPTDRAVEEALAELTVFARDRGWVVPEGCAVGDVGELDQRPARKPAWNLVRRIVEQQKATGLLVPSRAHVGFRWQDWEGERRWLTHRGGWLTETALAGCAREAVR